MTLEVAEALRTKGLLRREDIPSLAVSLLEHGHDTETIRRLAGLIGDELSEAAALFERMLAELGRRVPSAEESALRLATHLARAALARGANLRVLAADGARLAAAFDYLEPLMPFYAAHDAYDLPEVISRNEVDRELLEYSERVLHRPASDAFTRDKIE